MLNRTGYIKHAIHPLKTVLLVCLLLQSVTFYSGCNNEINTGSNLAQPVHLSQSNASEVENEFCYLSGTELKGFDQGSIEEILNNQNVLLVTDLTSANALEEAAAQAGGAFDYEGLPDLQILKGLIVYHNAEGERKIVPVIGQCLLPGVEKEAADGVADDQGQENFLSKTSRAKEIGTNWEAAELKPAELYQAVEALTKNENEDTQSCIFVYFGYDGNRTKALGAALITTSAELLKQQDGYRYDRVSSRIKIYTAGDGQLRSFNLKHGVSTDDSAVILKSEILSKPHNGKVLPRGGFAYSDLWAVNEIKENCVDMETESALKYRDGGNGSGFRCGINYLTIRYGALDYIAPTDQIMGE